MATEMCRSCMSLESNVIPLDEFFVNNYNMLTNLNVKINDKMPQYSCRKCTETVKSFVEFREKAISSENALWKLNMTSESKEAITDTQCIVKNELKIKLEVQDEEMNVNCDSFYEVPIENYNYTECEQQVKDENRKSTRRQTVKLEPQSSMDNNVKSKKSIMKVTENKALNCGICTKTVETTDDLKSHLETHKLTRQCGICFEDFVTWAQLFGHRLTHLPDKQKKCYLCTKRYLTALSMEFHYLSAHNDGLEKMLSCKMCSKKFSNPRRYKKHVWSVHSEARYFCDYCSKGYHSKSNLQKHIIVHLDYDTFFCVFCKFSCKSYGALQTHKIKEHCTTSVRCTTCHRYFENQEKCDKHSCIKNVCVVCPICGLQLSHTKKMSRHLKSHDAEGSYKCTRCPARYRSSSALKAHENRHDGNRTAACEFCPAKFYTRASVLKHRRIHTGERPYVCKVCGKGFTANHNLKMHMRVHGQFLIVKKNQEEAVPE